MTKQLELPWSHVEKADISRVGLLQLPAVEQTAKAPMGPRRAIPAKWIPGNIRCSVGMSEWR